jgi:hypothetical protein
MPTLSTEFQICSRREDDVTAAKDNIDGEAGTESDTDSDAVVLYSRPVQYRVSR